MSKTAQISNGFQADSVATSSLHSYRLWLWKAELVLTSCKAATSRFDWLKLLQKSCASLAQFFSMLEEAKTPSCCFRLRVPACMPCSKLNMQMKLAKTLMDSHTGRLKFSVRKHGADSIDGNLCSDKRWHAPDWQRGTLVVQ